jgi:conjugal transfer pilus assembly protein TraU
MGAVRTMCKRLTGVLLSALIVLAGPLPVAAQSANPVTQAKELACPDMNFGKQIGKICWSCFFPFTLFSIPIGGSSSKLPSGRAGPICLCPGRIGYPALGFTLGWWSPDHIIENTRIPWCVPSLGGAVLTEDEIKSSDIGAGGNSVLPARWGGRDNTPASDKDPGISYYNFHWIKFPIAYFIGWLSDFACSKKGNTAVDIAFMSEFDPSWNNDELAIWTSPETVLFTGPWAHIVCAADGVAATVNKPMDKAAFYCAGTWGQLYPFSGNTPTAQSGPRDASLNATKGIAKMHRFTLAKKSYGNKALCQNQLYFVLPKQQYRLQTLFPVAEKKNHWIGASTFRWGEWRTIPGAGEDYVWLQWSYHECCVTLW